MNIKKLLPLLFLLPASLCAKVGLYDDLKGTFDDAEFKKIFADNGITACIWVQEYRRNSVYEGKITKKTDIVMHNRCTKAAIQVAELTEHSMEPVYIDLRHTGKAPDFSNPMKARYKQLFPNWKTIMQKELDESHYEAKNEYVCDTSNAHGLDECTKNMGKKNENKEDDNAVSNTFNSIKGMANIFNKK